jgi:predicted nucleotidyltransferase
MRTSVVLQSLFPAIRREILATTLLAPEKSWYLSELAARLGTSPSSLQRELESLTKSGILNRRQDGRRSYYQAQSASPVFGELRLLFSKTAGIIPILQSELGTFRETIRWAAIYGSVARGEEHAQSDVDLLLVGPVALADLVPMLRRVERQLDRELNVTVYSGPEFTEKLSAGNHFLKSVVKSKLITLMGSRDELEGAAGGKQNPQTPDEQGRIGRYTRADRSGSGRRSNR